MNKFIDNQIDNMLQISESFVQSCKFAATQDDGEISAYEWKVLRITEKATRYFQKELKKAQQQNARVEKRKFVDDFRIKRKK